MAYEALRYVALCGPQWPDGTPLWEVQVSAPKLKKLAGEADRVAAANQLEDRIFPLRTLQTDPLTNHGSPDELFRRPHVVSMHVLAGHGKVAYEPGFGRLHGKYHDPFFVGRGYPRNFEKYRGDTPHDPPLYLWLEAASESLRLAGPGSQGQQRVRKLFSQLRWRGNGSPDKDMPPYWYTLRVPPGDTPPSQGMGQRVDAQFQHVIAEPVLAAGEAWPQKDDEAIKLPPFGLLAGAVSLAVAHGALPWLGDLEPKAPPPARPLQITRYPVRLVPDGIELRTSVNFLGRGELEGWFHIGIDNDALVLTLLVGRTAEADLLEPWREAWADAMPVSGTEESLQGFRVAADVASVPAFRWRIPALAGALPDSTDYAQGNNTTPGPKIKANFAKVPVEVPARSVRVDLLSPATTGSVDGVVNVGGGYFRLGTRDAMKAAMFRDGAVDPQFAQWAVANAADSLILAWSSPEPAKAAVSQWDIEATGDKANVALSLPLGRYDCAHNAQRLASELRGAYGLADPILREDGELPDKERMLPAFVPLRDGWLQVQVPNLPPYDPTKDAADLSLLAAPQENILSGFLRFGHAGQLPPIYSAFEALPERMVSEAPWQITVEGAQRLRVAVEIGVRTVVGEDGVQHTTAVMPQNGKALADNPELSMRGLLWFSSDRPDALEAIPRMGAGPGAFIDVPLDRRDKEARDPNESYVEIGVKRLALSVEPGKVARKELALSMALNKPTDAPVVRWQRHLYMPLAALMPLTRSARSAVRPLESRDLVPFIATGPANGALKPLADLLWNAGESLPHMGPGWTYALSKDVNSTSPEPADESQRCRLAWAAFGVPGYEVVPLAGGDEKWAIIAAPRFDLPVNDEAFATATLPASMQSPEDQAEQLAQPAVTALDWEALATFWGEQQRLLQLSRVAHSYLSGFKDEGEIDSAVVNSLVGHLKWDLSALGFTAPAAASRLPYGTMSIGGETWSGNRALMGFSGRFSVKADGSLKPEQEAAEEHMEVLGYSPGSFLEGHFLHDARRVGASPQLSLDGGRSRWRAISSHAAGSKIRGLFSVRAPVLVAAGEASLALWFKDLPLDADGNYIAEAGSISAAAWQDSQLEMRGVEWRLMATGDDNGFEMGDDTFGFFGLRMRPLRLDALVVEMIGGKPATTVPLSATLLAELFLGPRKEDVNDGGNLVEVKLVRQGQELVIDDIALSGGSSLNFPIWLSGGNADEAERESGFAAREAGLELTVAQVGWDKTKRELTLSAVALGFTFVGSRVLLTGVTPSRDGAAMLFDWANLNPATGWLAVQQGRLRVGNMPEFRFAHAVHIAPGEARQGQGPAPAPVSVKTVEQWGMDTSSGTNWPAELQPGCKASVLGTTAPAKFRAGPRAFAVTSQSGPERLRALLPGFPDGGSFELGLVAAIAPFMNERAAVASGSLSGSVVWHEGENVGHTLHLGSIRFEAGNGLRGEGAEEGWQGRLILNGDVTGTSAIAWPGVDLNTGSDIPMPPVASTITPVQFDHSIWHRHEVTWLLRGHEMSFGTAADLGERTEAVWSVSALARHTIFGTPARGGKPVEMLSFSSVDTLVLAPMRVFAPPWPRGGPAADLQASSTFAARYMTGDSGAHDPGMAWPGRGGLGTVLQGFSGALFREAFYGSDGHNDGKDLVFAGGFAGLVTVPGDDAAPLLRLPALVALEGSLRVTGTEPPIRQNASALVKVAWADGVAAQEVVAPWRNAMAPVTAAQLDVLQAIDAGTRRSPATDPRPERLFNAILVEQCFPVDLDGKGKLQGTPYFIAASVSIARAIQHARARRAERAAVSELASLSVLSRVSLTGSPGKAYRQGAAAVLRTSHGQTSSSPLPPHPAGLLMIVGDDLTHAAWLTRSLDDTEGADGRVAAIASELHKRPRFALVRDGSGKHTAIRLPQRQLSPRERRLPVLRHADVARGYMLSPDTSMLMAGAEEGWTGAVRDPVSGIAGMGRMAAWPAQAQRRTGGGHAVWLTQQRVPVYLPLQSRAVSTPIGWLDPGSARTRVPVGSEVNSALARAVGPAKKPVEDALEKPEGAALWQGVVPEQATTTSISDRAGVLIARRLRLEIAATNKDDKAYVFDTAFPRFGEPAQSSSSHARTERTPRPGILPENRDDKEPAVHRRPCVSPLQPGVNNRAVLGSADLVRGKTEWAVVDTDDYKGDASWTMNFVACPRSCGVISDPWDGTLDFAVEVDVLELGDQADLALYLLGFVLGADFANGQVLATASMIVNGTEFPFLSLHVREFESGPVPPVGTEKPRSGQVALVLDMRDPTDATEGPAPATNVLAAIRNAGPGPATVEVQFTLHPRVRAHLPKEKPQSKYALGVEQSIPHGKDRAPVTLRMPLFPVTRERGAMPLEPATVLFMDPAYDAGLASQPVEDALRIALPPEPPPPAPPHPALPAGRGDMMFVLSADRGRVNRRATVTFMADLRYEKRLPTTVAQLLPPGAGDIKFEKQSDPLKAPLVLDIHVQPRAGERRELYLAPRTQGAKPSKTRVTLAEVYELALATLVEVDGSTAQLAAGDVLELAARKAAGEGDGVAEGADAVMEVEVLDASKIGKSGMWETVKFDLRNQNLTLRLTLTDEPVVEPPPALYAALLRTTDPLTPDGTALSLPLYAQSPLPWRVDVPNARADFRAGLIHRTATFVWSLLRPADERGRLGAFVVKCDRNGQTYLPEEDTVDSDFRPFNQLSHHKRAPGSDTTSG
ncbi:hypothetical protein WKW79_34550 [Variovorax robiniae]|uniref:Uncharacterized protein n=1 Tax=Variovorax robiniae TaxID=1836199 RepID=A0ABU8XIN0_9BURK